MIWGGGRGSQPHFTTNIPPIRLTPSPVTATQYGAILADVDWLHGLGPAQRRGTHVLPPPSVLGPSPSLLPHQPGRWGGGGAVGVFQAAKSSAF